MEPVSAGALATGMEPVSAGALATAAAVSGGMNILGGAISAAQSYKYSRKMQKHQFNFIREMSSTAHQREVEDLRKAGLNPILSVMGGSGAVTPSNSGATIQGGNTNPNMDLVSALMSAKEIQKQDAEIKNIDAQTENVNADTQTKKQTLEWTPKLNQALIDYQNAQSGKAKAETMESFAKTAGIEFNNKMAEMDIKKRTREYGKELDIYKQQMELKLMEMGVDKSTSGQFAKAIGKWVNAISPFTEFTGKSTSETPTYNITHNY